MNELSAIKITIEAARTLMDEQATTICAMAQDEFALAAGTIFDGTLHASSVSVILLKVFKLITIAASLDHRLLPEL